MSKKMICFQDGSYLPQHDIMVPATDIGLIRGYGIFDYFPFKEGHPLFLDDYLDRLLRSTAKLNLDFPYTKAEIKHIVYKLIAKNEMEQGAFRCVVTGGVSDNYFKPHVGSFIIFQESLPTYSAANYDIGLALDLVEHQRQLPTIKSTNYIFPIQHMYVHMKCRADDVLYHQGGMITESSRSNFFALKDKTLITADAGILEGVTRKNVLKTAQENGYFIKLEYPKVDELSTYDAAFITSSTKGIMPIQTIYVDNSPLHLMVTKELKQLMLAFDDSRNAYIASKKLETA